MTVQNPFDRFIDGMAVHFGLDPAVTDQPGWTASPSDDRAASGVAAAYELRAHVAVPCPPDRAAEVVAGPPTSLEDWVDRMVAGGAELLGGAAMQTLGAGGLRPVDLAEGYELRRVRSDDDGVRQLIADLLERTDPDDADQADLDLDELDETIVLALDADGAVAAYASSRPWDEVARFGDIGVLTADGHRNKGLGGAVVTEMCRWLLEDGIDPLYRRHHDNTGSVRLSLGLGFVPATRLLAVRWTD